MVFSWSNSGEDNLGCVFFEVDVDMFEFVDFSWVLSYQIVVCIFVVCVMFGVIGLLDYYIVLSVLFIFFVMDLYMGYDIFVLIIEDIVGENRSRSQL